MTRIAPIMPPRGYRFPWWWLLTSRQRHRKTVQELFDGFWLCYNTGRQGKRNKLGVIVCSKTEVFRIRAVVTCSQVPRPLPTPQTKGAYSWAGLVVHTQGEIFSGKKPANSLALCAPVRSQDTAAYHGRRSRTQNAHPMAAVSKLDTKHPPQVGVCDGYLRWICWDYGKQAPVCT